MLLHWSETSSGPASIVLPASLVAGPIVHAAAKKHAVRGRANRMKRSLVLMWARRCQSIPDARCPSTPGRRASRVSPAYAVMMRCERHALAAGPDGGCVLCRRQKRAMERAMRRGRDPARRLAVLILAIVAALTTFALVGALLDTR